MHDFIIEKLNKSNWASSRVEVQKLTKTRPVCENVKSLPIVYDFIENKPVFSIKEVAKQTGISYNTAAKAVDMLVELKILIKINEQTRYKLFCYMEYIDIFRM